MYAPTMFDLRLFLFGRRVGVRLMRHQIDADRTVKLQRLTLSVSISCEY
jgi:hypothetical protein